MEQLRLRLAEARAVIQAHHPLRPGLDPLGTGLPVVQGPMANVSETTGLARSVLDAGAMPFFALGALRATRKAGAASEAGEEQPA